MSALLPTLIVGLGNPGPEYENTRHNVGFRVIDAVLERMRLESREHKFGGDVFSVRVGGRRVYLLKPLTYMNLSGKAVASARKALRIEPEEVLVVYDCMDLPVGRIRIRPEGGSGGHKGLQSIIDALNTQTIPRIRIGIGRPAGARNGVDYVLSPWPPEAAPAMTAAIQTAAEAALVAARQGVEKAMNLYNRWRPSSGTGNEKTSGDQARPPVATEGD